MVTAIRRATPGDPREARLTGSRCFCTECGEYFTSVSGFDKHQQVNAPCRPPNEVGLVRNDFNYWQHPGQDARFASR